MSLKTGISVRLASRASTLKTPTSGLAPTHLQANLIVLPSHYAASFRLLCARNPVPCPLLAESSHPGAFSTLTSHLQPSNTAFSSSSNPSTALPVATDIDLRCDAPKYRVYKHGVFVSEQPDIITEWQPNHVGFLIGCSYSFESALANAGLTPRHVAQGRNVPMYRTTIPLAPAGVFVGGTWVVSMRPYKMEDVERVREVTREFVTTHGEPVAWGWDAVRRLGIEDIARPEYGEGAMTEDGREAFCEGQSEGYAPVFWGCGVTPQEAVMRAGLEGVVMGHAPGHMVVLDVKDSEAFPRIEKE
ncbi:hypothetical protein OQA88_10086 [Cercophora sp. LCS_1]